MDHVNPLLGPIIALIAWTIVMLFLAAFKMQTGIRSGADLRGTPRGARGRDLEGRLDPKYLWARQNYEHLVEQPTLFYAIVFALVLMDQDHIVNVVIAWAYVGLRIAHSIVQALGKSRSITFVTSSLLLIALTVHAAMEYIAHL
ncbi:MAG: MAPEG family protein [Sphingomonas sp.]|nr:MAPEG family protein [Sphingomonas sp.]RZV50254.1 MAG: MAPEG family protein [Sphingomonadaceae bacterium]